MKILRRIFYLILILSALTVSAFCAKASGDPLARLDAALFVQTPSCDEPTASAILTLESVPELKSKNAAVEWYRDGILISPARSFLLQPGAYSVCSFSVVFSEQMPAQTVLTAVIRCGGNTRAFSAAVKPQNRDAEFYARLKTLSKPYRIDVSRFQNVVLVWAQDENGQYSILQNAFVCSTGKATPRGTYSGGGTIRWQTLFGSEETNWRYVYGQYITRITGSILFHSVPYYTPDASDLETLQYNLLGTRASLGCVRLTVEAAKWIYDNVPYGTQITLTDELSLPVRKPVAPKLSPADPRSGWDPTDPDENNPWRNENLSTLLR